MQNSNRSKTIRTISSKQFITIDDLVSMAGELYQGICKLSQYKHPLDIRRGIKQRKGVIQMIEHKENSETIKAGSKTYFFDLRSTREGKAFLSITESRLKGEGGERERNTILIFPEEAQKFADTVSEMVGKVLASNK